MNRILKTANDIKDIIVRDRRAIHQNPEIEFDLPLTTEYVIRNLIEMGYEPREVCKSGIVAEVGKPGRTFLLRGDMDALPTKETSELEFASKNDYGHLCGHDMHTAMLLGVARILKRYESELCGTVRLMFQPAEEYGVGAKAMLEGGLLDGPKVDAGMALHVSSSLVPGIVELKEGIATASMDSFFIKIQGRGGHSSTPHLAVDPLVIANSIYQTLYTLVSREVDPFETAVLTMGKMGGGEASNIIPDKAVVEGGIRCYNNSVRTHLVARVAQTAESITSALRGSCEITWVSTPSITNDPDLCKVLRPFMEEIVGADGMGTAERPLSGTEDFSYVSERIPVVFAWLGAGRPGNYPLHNPNVVFDEDALPFGAALAANCAINWLK